MENKRKHLEFIQKLIDRFSNNSFQLKKWTVTIIVGVLAISYRQKFGNQFVISFIPVITFWILDGFYLSKERRYRSLYDFVRKQEESTIDFNLKTDQFEGGKNSWFQAVFSITLLTFYLSVMLSLLLVILIFSE